MVAADENKSDNVGEKSASAENEGKESKRKDHQLFTIEGMCGEFSSG